MNLSLRSLLGRLAVFRQRRVRTPTMLQMEAVECGAVSLGIVLGYFGRYVAFDTLRRECGVSRDGAKAGNILRAAAHFGLEAHGYRRLAQRVLDGPFPSIVFWDFKHYVVVEGAGDGHVHLNDPASGPRTISADEFIRRYSGIVLTFEKTAGFKPGGQRPTLIARLATWSSEYKGPIGFVAAVGLLLALPSFVAPGLTGVFVNRLLIDGRASWLGPLIAAAGVAAAFVALLSWLKEDTLLRLGTGAGSRRSADFVWHVLRLPVEYFDQRYIGDIVNRATSVESVANLLTTEFGTALIGALVAGLLLVLMTLIDPWLALVSAAGALVNVVALRLLYRARVDAAAHLRTAQAKLFSSSIVGVKTIEMLKATAGDSDYFAQWASQQARVIDAEQRQARLEQSSAIVSPIVIMLSTGAALAVGGLRVIDGALSIGGLIAFQALFYQIAGPVQRMSQTAATAQQMTADLARLDDVLDAPLDWRHRPGHETAGRAPPGEAGLKVDGLSFGYNRLEPPLIENFSLDVQAGAWVALVGDSGSGKSTISRLLCGLYTPWQGTIEIDGRPIFGIGRRELAHLIAVVQQDIHLFGASLQDNLTLWDPSITREALVAAARDAQILDTIATRSGRFDTHIDEAGRNLSGGERQRIEIARAIARSPSLLILDEATSALDPVTELDIMQALRRRGMTCIVIAHRLSTIRDCDEIIVLDHGKIAERGRHGELMASQGPYARMVGEVGA